MEEGCLKTTLFFSLAFLRPGERRIARTTFDCPADHENNRVDRYGPNIGTFAPNPYFSYDATQQRYGLIMF